MLSYEKCGNNRIFNWPLQILKIYLYQYVWASPQGLGRIKEMSIAPKEIVLKMLSKFPLGRLEQNIQ